jgi:hypothetical protein
VKRGVFCLLLLSACLTSDDSSSVDEYALAWTCRSPEGCERTAEIERIDRATRVRRDYHFTSTQDEAFAAQGKQITSKLLPSHCFWLHYLMLFGHALENTVICFGPGGFELELAIPNQDPATSSLWLVEGRDLALLGADTKASRADRLARPSENAQLRAGQGATRELGRSQ